MADEVAIIRILGGTSTGSLGSSSGSSANGSQTQSQQYNAILKGLGISSFSGIKAQFKDIGTTMSEDGAKKMAPMFSGILKGLGIASGIGIIVAIVSNFKFLINMIELLLKMVAFLFNPIAMVLSVLLIPIMLMLKPIIQVMHQLMMPFLKLAMDKMKQVQAGGGSAADMYSAMMPILAGGLAVVEGYIVSGFIGTITDALATVFPFAKADLKKFSDDFFGSTTAQVVNNIGNLKGISYDEFKNLSDAIQTTLGNAYGKEGSVTKAYQSYMTSHTNSATLTNMSSIEKLWEGINGGMDRGQATFFDAAYAAVSQGWAKLKNIFDSTPSTSNNGIPLTTTINPIDMTLQPGGLLTLINQRGTTGGVQTH
jgi:hypothetical protein